MRINCIYHADCLDGLSAAAMFKKAHMEHTVEFFPGMYNKPLPDMPDADMLAIVDFSLSVEEYENQARRFASVITLDHHRGALVTLDATRSLQTAVFDDTMCGAELVCKHYEMETPELVRIVGDRDLWKWTRPETAAVTAWLMQLMSTPEEMLQRIELYEESPSFRQEARYIGETILTTNRKLIERIEERAFATTVRGVPCIVVFSPVFKSELGNNLLKLHTFAKCAVIVDPDGSDTASVSIRSVDNESALKLAKELGGGGHPNASGATINIAELLEVANAR